MRGRGLIVLGVMVVASSVARADWRDFLPVPFENGAFVDLFTSYEHDNLTNAGQSTNWTDYFVRERLTFYSDGYSYHPRFLRYHFSIAGALRQEDYESSAGNSSAWHNDTGTEYDIRLIFLPEHFYNLTAFAARYEPLYKEQAATSHSNVETTYGTSFRYRKKPYFLHTGYDNEHIDSGLSWSDINHYYLDGEYFKRFVSGNELSFSAAFNPTWFNASGGTDGHTYQYLAGNIVNLQRVRLSSNVSALETDQSGGVSQTFKGDQVSVYELLTAYLPWNFRSNLSYRYLDNSTTINEPGSVPDQKLSNTNNDVELDLYHRLYESLDTTYTFLDSWRDYTDGNTSFLSNSLNVNYTKVIPRGRVTTGAGVGQGVTDNHGQANALNETHPGTPVPGSFTLQQPNADPSTILLYLKSPLPPFQLILLTENVDYVVTPVQNTFEVRVFNLPSEFVVPGTYDFLVTYSLASGDYRIETDTYTSNASVELLDDLLTPYFSYVAIRTDVLSGAFPGVPLDSTTYTGGLLVHRGPVRLRGEYQDFQWDAAPYQSWRAEIQYAGALSDTVSLYGAAYYLNKHYSSPSVEYYGNVTEYTEETESVSANIQKQFLVQNLFLAGGGSYSHISGLVDTNAYSGNSSLIWKIGLVDLTVGVNAYGSDNSGSTSVATRRDHELVYVKFRRRLF